MRIGILIVFALLSCAVVEAPKGGAEDKLAPELQATLPAHLSVSQSTNAHMVLQFSEWMVNPVPTGVIQISPPSNKPLQISTEGDQIWIDAQLDTLTTYALSLTTAVKDLHGNGIASPLQLVFSTGPQLDSSSLEGLVLIPDSLLRKRDYPIVGLYPLGKAERASRSYLKKLLDSNLVPLEEPDLSRESPLYMVQTDSLGQFRLRGIAPGKYRIAVFQDQNRNNRIDMISEIAGTGENDVSIVDGEVRAIQYLSLGGQDTTKQRIQNAQILTSEYLKVDWYKTLRIAPKCSLMSIDSTPFANPQQSWVGTDKHTLMLYFQGITRGNSYWLSCANQPLRRLEWIPRADSLASANISVTFADEFSAMDSIPHWIAVSSNPWQSKINEFRIAINGDTLMLQDSLIDPIRRLLWPKQAVPMGEEITLLRWTNPTDSLEKPKIMGRYKTINKLKIHGLQGRIPNGKPSHMVRLKSKSLATAWRTYCNADGEFNFSRLPDANYALDIYLDTDRDSLPDAGQISPYFRSGSWRKLNDSISISPTPMLKMDTLYQKILLP